MLMGVIDGNKCCQAHGEVSICPPLDLYKKKAQSMDKGEEEKGYDSDILLFYSTFFFNETWFEHRRSFVKVYFLGSLLTFHCMQ